MRSTKRRKNAYPEGARETVEAWLAEYDAIPSTEALARKHRLPVQTVRHIFSDLSPGLSRAAVDDIRRTRARALLVGSYKEIARRTGLSMKQIRNIVTKCRARPTAEQGAI